MDDVRTNTGSTMFYRDKISAHDDGRPPQRTAAEADHAAAELRTFLSRHLCAAGDNGGVSTSD